MRTIALIGEQAFQKLADSSVTVVGVGGVGGYVLETLARSGVGSFTLIDGDCVDETNLNRQIISTVDNIGMPKVEVARQRVLSINPDAKVNAVYSRINADNASTLLGTPDYVADCIDSLSDKLSLVLAAKEKGLPVISAMGAGNRYGVCSFTVCDVFDTKYDPLAKKFRKMLKDAQVDKLTVCYTQDPATANQGVVASICHNPALCGVTMGGYIVNELIKADTYQKKGE